MCTFQGAQRCVSKVPAIFMGGEYIGIWASLIAHLVKNLPAMQETPVQFLGREDPLENREATHSSILGLTWWLSW